jgi:hypothetical protein
MGAGSPGANLAVTAIAFGVVAAGAAAWLFVALRTGRTLYVSRMSAPRMIERRSDPVGYWAMIVTLCFVTAFFAGGVVWLLWLD